MGTYTRIRDAIGWLTAAVVAVGVSGCMTPSFAPWPNPYPYGYPPYPPPGPPAAATPPADKSQPAVPDNRTATAASPVVVQAQHHPTPAAGPPPAAAAAVPPTPAAAPPHVPGSAPLHMPAPAPPNPHARSTPTAGGATLNLGPGEMPIDRALELAKRVDDCTAANRYLHDRLRTLEAKADEREEAIAESRRVVQSAEVEVAQTRADLGVVRKEVDRLKQRLKQVEKDETETLKLVIDALEKLLREEEQP